MKKLLRWLLTTSPLSADVGLLVTRVSVGLMLALAHGADKMRNLDAFVAKVDRLNLANAQVLGIAAALVEFLGGLLLALGLFGRAAALAVVVTMGVAAFQVHGGAPFAKQELAVLYGLGALAVVLAGPGRISVDHLLFGRQRGQGTKGAGAPSKDDAPRLIPPPPPKGEDDQTGSATDWLKPGAVKAPVASPRSKKDTDKPGS